MHRAPALPGDTYSAALGINASGQVVGYSTTAGDAGHAVEWTPGGGITDLNSRIDPGLGWTLREAQAINDSGQIVAILST
jgi:probable HAF family extracellular repeat protein